MFLTSFTKCCKFYKFLRFSSKLPNVTSVLPAAFLINAFSLRKRKIRSPGVNASWRPRLINFQVGSRALYTVFLVRPTAMAILATGSLSFLFMLRMIVTSRWRRGWRNKAIATRSAGGIRKHEECGRKVVADNLLLQLQLET